MTQKTRRWSRANKTTAHHNRQDLKLNSLLQMGASDKYPTCKEGHTAKTWGISNNTAWTLKTDWERSVRERTEAEMSNNGNSRGFLQKDQGDPRYQKESLHVYHRWKASRSPAYRRTKAPRSLGTRTFDKSSTG